MAWILYTTCGCEVKNKSNDFLLLDPCAQTRWRTDEHELHVLDLLCARAKQEKYDNMSLNDNYKKKIRKIDFFFFVILLNMNHSVS